MCFVAIIVIIIRKAKIIVTLSRERYRGTLQSQYAFQQCKNCENRLTFDKVTESLKVGNCLRHSAVYYY